MITVNITGKIEERVKRIAEIMGVEPECMVEVTVHDLFKTLRRGFEKSTPEYVDQAKRAFSLSLADYKSEKAMEGEE